MAKALIMPHMRRRRASPGMTKQMTALIDSVIDPQEEQDLDGQAQDDPLEALLMPVDQPGDAEVGAGQALPARLPIAVQAQGQAAGQDLHPIEGARRRCGVCIAELNRLNHKKEKDKLSKQKTQCQVCTTALCLKHRIQTCEGCAGPRQDGAPGGDEDAVYV